MVAGAGGHKNGGLAFTEDTASVCHAEKFWRGTEGMVEQEGKCTY